MSALRAQLMTVSQGVIERENVAAKGKAANHHDHSCTASRSV
jgi:hypothetical protein